MSFKCCFVTMIHTVIQVDPKLVATLLPRPLELGSQVWDITPSPHLSSGAMKLYLGRKLKGSQLGRNKQN